MKNTFLVFIIFISSFINAEVLPLHNAWQLQGTSLPISNMSVFNKESIKTVWAYDKNTKQWKAYSPDTSLSNLIQSSSNITPLENILAHEGFWIHSDGNTSVTLGTNLIQTNETVSIDSGWQLVGVSTDSNISQFDNRCVDYIWKYDSNMTSNEWKLHISNGKSYQHQYRDIDTLIANEGFWVYGNALCDIPLNVDQATINIAHKFAKATQGATYGTSAASFAIDNNLSTYNHTKCNATDNWWQLELPKNSKISKFIIHNRSGQTARLNGTKVYFANEDFNGSLIESNHIETLNSSMEQLFEYETLQDANYLLLKADGDNCLHTPEVEVYGQTPSKPLFLKHETKHIISGATNIGDTIITLSGFDYQNDVLSYTIDHTAFNIDNQGEITLKSQLPSGTHSIVVSVSDGTDSVSATLDIVVTSSTVIEDILKTGDILNTPVTPSELIDATLAEIESTKNLLIDAKLKIFNFNADGTIKDDGSSLTNIDWNPTHDASTIIPTLGKNVSLLKTNSVTDTSKTIYNKDIAVIGEKLNNRYMLFGANPMRNAINDEMNIMLENSLAWLTARKDLKENPFNIVIAHVDESYYFKDESSIRTWLDTHYAGQVIYNGENTCDDAALADCLTGTIDMLIISQVSNDDTNLSEISATVNQALENNISVLYIHHDGGLKALGKELFLNVFDVSYEWDNYWKKLELKAYNPINNLNNTPSALEAIKTMFTHFKNKDYNFNWSLCDGEDCSLTALPEFEEAALYSKMMVDNFDINKQDIFIEDGYRLQKLLILSADKFRQNVKYPMDKETSNDTDFMKSYYADHVVYNYRSINPVQKDMGNFSRSDFSHITPTNKTVNLLSKANFRAAGVYMLPGKTMKVTRLDNTPVNTSIFINSLRTGSTHVFQEATSETNGYNRPKYLQSKKIEIKPGETLTLTSPYGGPVQISFNINDINTSLSFENVGEHPFWASSSDDTIFAKKLIDAEYDWAEVATNGFEVHSKLKLIKESLNDSRWGTAANLASSIEKYIGTYPYVLAGYKVQDSAMIPEIYNFAQENNISMQTINKVQHMNADQATCGYGCSGNPYDAYWSFDPTGHGDIHELGHNLEAGSRFLFEGFELHAITNPYSYYTKSKYNEQTQGEPNCQNLPFQELFEKLNASVGETNSTAYLQENLWKDSGWSQQVLVTIQAMMHTQKMGKLINGWHLLARLHLLAREIPLARASWETKKTSIGFSEYTLSEFDAIRKNDWLLVSLSYAAKVDFRDYLTMMGMEFTQKAANQVSSYAYDMAPRKFFISTKNGYCKTDIYGSYLDKQTLDVNGTSIWPE